MPCVGRVLIVDGGTSGMSLAMCLRQAQTATDIVEINSTWGTYGAGLADEFANSASIANALSQFMKRRFERCRLVVENSAMLGELEMRAAQIEQQTALSRQSAAALALPY